jgi:hypothetical protein
MKDSFWTTSTVSSDLPKPLTLDGIKAAMASIPPAPVPQRFEMNGEIHGESDSFGNLRVSQALLDLMKRAIPTVKTPVPHFGGTQVILDPEFPKPLRPLIQDTLNRLHDRFDLHGWNNDPD